MSTNSRGRGPLLGLTAAHAVDDLYQGAVPALIPFFVADRHYSYTAAAGITLAATLLSSVAQPVFGVLTDRRHLEWLVPAGITLAGVGIGLCGLVDSYRLTWLAIALSGLGVAAFHPEASRAARTAAGGSAAGMSWFALGGNIGFTAGPVLVAPVVSAGGLGATPVLALPALVAGAAFTGRRLRSPRLRTTAEPSAESAEGRDDWRAFGWLVGVVVCRSICVFGLFSFLALFLIHARGATRAESNAALAVFLATGCIGTLTGGWLADRRGRVFAVRVGYALTLLGLACLLVSSGFAIGCLAAALLGVALYVPFSVHVTLGQEYLPTRVGTASGVTLGLAVSVGGVAAPALGVVADHAGLAAALAVLMVFPVVALALSLRLPDPRGPGHHQNRRTAASARR